MKRVSKSFSFMIPVVYIQSVNKLYDPGVTLSKRTRKPVGYLRKSAAACAAIDNYLSMLSKYVNKSLLTNFKFVNLEVYIGCFLKTGFERRDVDNTLKIFQDCLQRYFDFNDSNIINIHSYKRVVINDPDKLEYLYVNIINNSAKESELIVGRSNLPKPGLIGLSEVTYED